MSCQNSSFPVKTSYLAYEKVICHIFRRHFTHEWGMSRMKESCHILMGHVPYEWVMAHVSHVTYEWLTSCMNESRYMSIGHVPMTHSYMIFMNEICPWLIHIWHCWISHVVNESCHMSMDINESCHMCISHVHMTHSYIFDMTHSYMTKPIYMCHMTHICHTSCAQRNRSCLICGIAIYFNMDFIYLCARVIHGTNDSAVHMS